MLYCMIYLKAIVPCYTTTILYCMQHQIQALSYLCINFALLFIKKPISNKFVVLVQYSTCSAKHSSTGNNFVEPFYAKSSTLGPLHGEDRVESPALKERGPLRARREEPNDDDPLLALLPLFVAGEELKGGGRKFVRVRSICLV